MSSWYPIFCELPKIGNKPDGITIERHVAEQLEKMSPTAKAKLAAAILRTIPHTFPYDKEYFDTLREIDMLLEGSPNFVGT